MGLFEDFWGEAPKRKKRSIKKKVKKKTINKKSNQQSSLSSTRINNDFKKIKKILMSFNPKEVLSPHTLKKKNEKDIENILFGALGVKLKGIKSQIKKSNGIVDMSYKKIGIEIKLCKEGGVKRIRDRLNRQLREYNKKFKKLVIYMLNFEKSSGQKNAYIKRFLEKDFEDIKSVKKRDFVLIIKKV